MVQKKVNKHCPAFESAILKDKQLRDKLITEGTRKIKKNNGDK